MSEQSTERGAAEELSGAPATPAEDNAPASTEDDPRVRGFAEEATDSPDTE